MFSQTGSFRNRKAACALGLAALLPSGALAADPLHFVVRSVADAPDKKPGDQQCASAQGDCTLRAAFDEANAQAKPAIIELQPGNYVVETGLVATAPITLQGTQPAEVTVTAAPAFQGDRLLIIEGPRDAGWREIRDLTLNGGGRTGVVMTDRGVPLRVSRSVIEHGLSGDGGAGIASSGPLVLLQSSVIDNQVVERGRGGALLLEHSSAWITQTTLTGNVGRNGGGIFARSADVVIDFSSLVGNTGGPVGGYQQNPRSSLRIRGSWLGETRSASGKRRVDCRSTAQGEDRQGIVSEGNNLLAVTGPTGSVIRDAAWQDSWEFFCELSGHNDRSGTFMSPLEGEWRRVTDSTGLVGVEGAQSHPVFRAVPAEECPDSDAFGRLRPSGEACDIGAVRAPTWGRASASSPDQPVQSDREPRESRVWLTVLGIIAVIVTILLVIRMRSGSQKS
jgi:hypothetical protein